MSFFNSKKTRPLFAHQTIFYDSKSFYQNTETSKKPLLDKGFPPTN